MPLAMSARAAKTSGKTFDPVNGNAGARVGVEGIATWMPATVVEDARVDGLVDPTPVTGTVVSGAETVVVAGSDVVVAIVSVVVVDVAVLVVTTTVVPATLVDVSIEVVGAAVVVVDFLQVVVVVELQPLPPVFHRTPAWPGAPLELSQDVGCS